MSSEPTFTRAPASGVSRLFLGSTPTLYRGPLAAAFRWRCIALLTTTGRKSGQPRTTAVSFMPLDGKYYTVVGWGERSNWYRNVRANPQVTLRIGQERHAAVARLVDDPARRRALIERIRARSGQCGPPRGMRWLLKTTRVFDYEGELRMATEHSSEIPVIEFTPEASVVKSA